MTTDTADRQLDRRFGHRAYLFSVSYFQRLVEHTLQAVGLTPTQFRLLLFSDCYQDPQSLSKLSDSLELGLSTVSDAVGELVKRGALERVERSSDHRARLVAILPGGRLLLSRAVHQLRPAMDCFWESFPDASHGYFASKTLAVARSHGLVREGNFSLNPNIALAEEILRTMVLVKRALREFNLSFAEYQILLELVYERDGTRPVEVGQRLGLTRSVVAHASDALERRSYISSFPDAIDKRSVRLELTSDGYRCLTSAAVCVRDVLKNGILPDTEERDMAVHHALASYFFNNRTAEEQSI